MGKKLMEKVFNLIGFELEEDVEKEEERGVSKGEAYGPFRPKKNNLVGLPTAMRPLKMVISKPVRFEQVQVIADYLKIRQPVVVNVEELDLTVARRVMDFLSGTVYALNGSMQKISSGIFLFVPDNVEVTGDVDQIKTEEGLFGVPKAK
ncbi:MAG: cell division protein SepF [Clostridia bacterium]|jgi:cell division inhibitor SepF|nr:cell division protein SepF [Clostridia bacterium]